MVATFMRYPYGAPVEVYRNLMTNPTFEVNIDGWTAFAGSATLIRALRPTGVDSIAGTYCLRATATTTANSDVQGPQMPATPGVTYSVTGSVRSTTPRNNAWIMRFYNAADALIGTSILGAYTMSSSTWQTVSMSALAPALTAYVRVQWRVQTPAIGEMHYLDTVGVVASATPVAYFDGATPSVGTTIYRWLGMDNASASVAETPGAGDYLTPALSILKPYQVRREARSQGRALLDSAEVRAVLVPAGPRAGQLQALFDTPAAAMDAVAWFSGANTFQVVDEAYASMWFVVSDGTVEFEYSESTPGTVTVPFIETSAP